MKTNFAEPLEFSFAPPRSFHLDAQGAGPSWPIPSRGNNRIEGEANRANQHVAICEDTRANFLGVLRGRRCLKEQKRLHPRRALVHPPPQGGSNRRIRPLICINDQQCICDADRELARDHVMRRPRDLVPIHASMVARTQVRLGSVALGKVAAQDASEPNLAEDSRRRPVLKVGELLASHVVRFGQSCFPSLAKTATTSAIGASAADKARLSDPSEDCPANRLAQSRIRVYPLVMTQSYQQLMFRT